MQNMFDHNQWAIKCSRNPCPLSSEIDGRFRIDHSFVYRNTEGGGPLLIIPSFKSKAAFKRQTKVGKLVWANSSWRV